MSDQVCDLVAAIRRDVEAATLLLDGVLDKVGSLAALTADVPSAEAAAMTGSDTEATEPHIAAEVPVTREAWPAGCHKPGSCERHRQCCYVPCPHMDLNIEAEVDAAVAAQPVAQHEAAPATKPQSLPFKMLAAQRRAVEPADQAQIERFIAERGVTKLPAAAVEATSATIPPEDRAAIAAHNQKRREAEAEEAKRRGWGHRK